MFEVPALTAVTNPVPAFTVATAGVPLVQLPPGVPLEVYVAVAPMQSGVVPLTVPALTFGFIVTACCAETTPPQPPVIVYMILHVPAVTPVTKPAALTVATAGTLLLHAPVPPPSTTPFAV